jgi:error-prone DNA polymerase
VVEDYGSTGVSLRQHPLAFLREELAIAGYRRCSDLATLPDARRIAVAGLVLVRQRPGSASGVMFITIEDEAGIANLVVWPSLFEQYRRVVLSARMIGVEGRVQCQGEVIHLVAERLVDLGELLRSVGERDQPAAGGDELGRKPRDIYIPDLRLGSGIKVPTRDFR